MQRKALFPVDLELSGSKMTNRDCPKEVLCEKKIKEKFGYWFDTKNSQKILKMQKACEFPKELLCSKPKRIELFGL